MSPDSASDERRTIATASDLPHSLTPAMRHALEVLRAEPNRGFERVDLEALDEALT